MFDEIIIKEMSPIDAYNYGRQMMEKELNKLGECEYNKGRADKYQEIISEYMLLTEEQVKEIRADVIEEFVNECVKFEDLTFDREHIRRVKMIAEQLKE